MPSQEITSEKNAGSDYQRTAGLNSDLRNDLYSGLPNLNHGKANEANSQTGTPDYLDFSDPYGNSYKPEKGAPERRTIIAEQASLLTNMVNADSSSLGGNAAQIENQIKAVKAEEKTDESKNNGYLSAKDRNSLFTEEAKINQEIKGDGTPPGSSEPPPGSSEPPPAPGSLKSPIDTGNVIMGTALIPHDLGANSEIQGLQNFDSKSGVEQGIQNMYVNQNKGETPDVASMQADVKAGVIPMMSLRTSSYNDVTSGKDDAYLTQVADDLKKVGGTVLLRPNWEMDGSGREMYGTADQFKASWQYMHNFLEKQGVTNVKWVFAPDAPAYDTPRPSWANDAKNYYPGSSYVDYVGADGYSGINGEKYKSPAQIFDSSLAFAQSVDKPFMIAETGVSSTLGASDDALYMQQMAAWVKANPDVKAISWFSEGQNNVFANPQEAAAFEAMEKELGAPSAN